MEDEKQEIPEVTPMEESHNSSSTPDFLTDEGKFSDSFLESLPDGLGKHSILQKYTSPADLIKGSINAQKLAGKKAEEFWTSEDEDIVMSRKKIMGVPDTFEGYEYDTSDIPEEHREAAKAEADEFRKFAQENSFPKGVTEKILAWDKARGISALAAKSEQSANSFRETENSLRQEWKGDKYEYNIAKVSEAMDYLGLGEFKDNPKYGNDPEFVKAINDKIVPLLADDTIIEARQKENFATISDTLRDLDQKMISYTGNTNDPAYKNMTAERGRLLAKMT